MKACSKPSSKCSKGPSATSPPQGGRKHPEQQYIQIDTSNILFICGGTFAGLEEHISKRIGKKTIGFGPQHEHREENLGSLLNQVVSDDLTDFGMIPEFVGRLPMLAPLDPLNEEALIRILTEPRNALVRQYQKLFEVEGAEVIFEEKALKEIARRAKERDTGARGLRSIVEEIMLDVMYELPDMEHKGRHIVTEDVVRGRKPMFGLIPEKKSA